MRFDKEKTVAPVDNSARTEEYLSIPRYSVAVSSHLGAVRSENEDNFVVNNIIRLFTKKESNMKGSGIKEPLVCGVFDGMGGEANGEQASRIAAESSAAIYKTLKKEPQHPDFPIERFVRESDAGILRMLSDAKAKRGGSTFVIAVFVNDCVYAYSLGDSRMYLLSGGVLKRVTNDHTLAMKKYRANIYTLEEALSGPDSHKLTAFLGMDMDNGGMTVEKYPPFRLRRGDKLLLCSDGLYDMCGEDEIISTLNADSPTVSLDLVEKALEHGGVDNITAIVVQKEL